ncbi:MAG: hypothetical protein FJ042_03535 [Candidatus Cloacimonetes bacterium]|nr:hypothetical protein [Candidatus Cloacimonadota bacterium]
MQQTGDDGALKESAPTTGQAPLMQQTGDDGALKESAPTTGQAPLMQRKSGVRKAIAMKRFLLCIPFLIALTSATWALDESASTVQGAEGKRPADKTGAVERHPMSQSWQEAIEADLEYLLDHPDDDEVRLKLGYSYMMSNQPLLALREYRRLTQKDKDNPDAWVGVIWAYNGMRQYPLAISTARDQVALHPEYAPFYNLWANALLRTGDNAAARYYYSMALEHAPFDIVQRRSAYEGLGWSYHYLDDIHRSRDNFYKAKALMPLGEPVYGGEINEQGRWQTEFAWTRAHAAVNVYYGSQAYGQGSWMVRASFEELQNDDGHYRTAFQVQGHKQLSVLRSSVSGTLITGIDEDHYPAYAAGIGSRANLYLRAAAITPYHRINLTRFPHFNIYQNDLGLSLTYRKTELGYQLSYIYRDADPMDSDEQNFLHHIWMQYPILPMTHLGLYAGWGDLSWWTTGSGSINDLNEGMDSYYGLDILFPLVGSLAAGFYNQFGLCNSDWEYLFKCRLNLVY